MEDGEASRGQARRNRGGLVIRWPFGAGRGFRRTCVEAGYARPKEKARPEPRFPVFPPRVD